MGDHEPAESLTVKQRQVKQRFVEEVGYWSELYDDALRLDPEYFDHFRALLAHTYEDGALDPKTKELMLVAVNCSVAHLNPNGVRVHVGNALDRGATFEEVREVFQRSTGVGIHAITEGVPILADVAGVPEVDSAEGRAERRRVREVFEGGRGYWSELWEVVLQIDPEFLEHYANLSSHPYDVGPLDHKVKEFVAVANDSVTTHLYLPGLRIHMENALGYGATREELLEVMELVSVIGMQTQFECAPVLIEEARERGMLPERFAE